MAVSKGRRLWSAIAACCVAQAASAAVTVAPGYLLRRIPTPDPVVGGVVRAGNAIFVGQGAYGAGGERIVRLDGTIATTIADGFGSLGGFDYDGSTLYAVDNCYTSDFGCDTATTGDTLYAVPTAATRTTAAAAGSVEALPAGTIPFAADVLVVPGAVLISDSVGPGAGRIVEVVGNTASNLITGLDYASGLALQGGSTLLVGNSNFPTPGTIGKYTLAGAAGGTLASGLSGVYALALDGGGNVLVTGGLTNDFSSSTLMAVNPMGVASERAHGFSFTGDVSYDAARDAALVLDFGATDIAAICGDGNADGLCDADCANPVAFTAVKLQLGGLGTAPGDDTLTASGTASIGGPIDPVIDGAHLWIDDVNAIVVADVVVPGGAYDPLTHVGWKANGAGTSWKYRNAAGVVGVTGVSIKRLANPAGAVKFKFTGKHGGYAATGAALPLTTGVAVGAGHCAAQALACTPSGTKKLKCD